MIHNPSRNDVIQQYNVCMNLAISQFTTDGKLIKTTSNVRGPGGANVRPSKVLHSPSFAECKALFHSRG